MIRITVYAGDGPDGRDPSMRDWSEHGPEEALRRIGLEYKTADYFRTRQVVIVLQPAEDAGDAAEIKAKVRAAAVALEGTGLL